MAKNKIKKLKQSDINRNTSIEVSHTIRKIKENERKYTIILVIFFIILISIIGYNALSIDNNVLVNDVKSLSDNSEYYSLTSNLVVMNGKNVMSDKEGLNSKRKVLYLDNNTDKEKKYKIYLVSKDENNINKSNIKYSLDGKIKDLNDDLFYEIKVGKREKVEIYYNMWVSDSVLEKDNFYYEGHFKIKS